MLTETFIRPAQAADVPEIKKIATAAYAIYVARIGREPAPMIADFDAHVARDEVFILEDAAEITGYIISFIKDGGQFIENVAVRPSRQGSGHGWRLLKFVEDLAWQHNFPRAFLYTNAKMTENLDFYPRLGYLETHRVHEDGFDRVYFEKVLSHER